MIDWELLKVFSEIGSKLYSKIIREMKILRNTNQQYCIISDPRNDRKLQKC